MKRPEKKRLLVQTGIAARQSRLWVAFAFSLVGAIGTAPANVAVAGKEAPDKVPKKPETAVGNLYIQEYRVEGAHLLPRIEVEKAVYPFLGPGRTPEDVEKARVALEQAYKEKGYQAVSVEIPPQQMRRGVVMLQVVEAPVGRLRVHGSRYFSLDQIKKGAPSLAEGTVPEFNAITRDIVALNQLPDRRVTPTLHSGVAPGTVDIDLNVKDTFPLHGSLELNNRYSASTTPLRLNGSISYNNLWQLGHSAGVSFQIAPELIDDAKVLSGFYTARFPNLSWLSLTVQGTKQNSSVSTLPGSAVAGNGQVVGMRINMSLPTGKDFYSSLSLGLDYKHFLQDVLLGGTEILTPITYYPLSAAYSATWVGKGRTTELNAGINFNLRGLGSDVAGFDANRFNADGNYLYVRGDLAHTHDLPAGFQIFAKVQGQAAGQALPTSEEFAGGGLGTVRGYLEAEALGDNALFGSLELRSPSLLHWFSDKSGEWRVYVFCEGGMLALNDPLPEQQSRFNLASYGIGSRFRLAQHLNGSIDFGVPLISGVSATSHDPLVTFRVWAEF